jgi:hypothetical protein
MLQKSRMLQIRDGKGEAVLRYCEPLPTKEMQHHTAFPASSPEGRVKIDQYLTKSKLHLGGTFGTDSEIYITSCGY